jgi:hypothetical protein
MDNTAQGTYPKEARQEEKFSKWNPERKDDM